MENDSSPPSIVSTVANVLVAVPATVTASILTTVVATALAIVTTSVVLMLLAYAKTFPDISRIDIFSDPNFKRWQEHIYSTLGHAWSGMGVVRSKPEC